MRDEPPVRYTYPIFPEQTRPKGELLADIGCQACWYYYCLAHKIYCRVGKSIDDQFGLLEGDPWLSKNYEQLARSVALQYGLKDPSDFMKYWPLVTMETSRLKMTPPVSEYMKPLRLRILN